MFDAVQHQMDATSTLDLFAPSADMVFVADAAATAPVTDGNCSNKPAWVAVALSDGTITAIRLPACGRYDPGWRAS
jgi:hypothetical protein